MPGKGNPILRARVPRKYQAAVQLEARKLGITVSEHVRNILKEHFERVWHTQTSGVAHLQALTSLAKQYMVTVQLSRQGPMKVPMKTEKGTGLPGAPKRDDLEKLVWQAFQEAIAYSKTEKAAKGALTRLKALQVANLLMRTELAILKDQDDASVDELLKELEGDTHELEKENRKIQRPEG